MAHIFDKLPSTFFSVLSSPNRHVYVDCLLIIYNSIDTIEDAFQGEREYVIHKLIDYFDDHEKASVDNEDARTSRQKAVSVINAFKQNGWLGEEELGDYKVSLNLFDYSIKILDVLQGIAVGEQTEYTGEIFTIYSLLKAFDLKEGVGILEQAYKKTNDVLRKLKSLKANIYRFYYDITKSKHKDELSELLEKLLVDYKVNFFDSAYYNLKTTDSLPRYKRTILDKLASIYNNEETLEQLTRDVMSIKRVDDYNKAFDYVESTIRHIKDSFEGLELLILAIDRKNEQYIHAVANKILFLTNHSENLEGILNRLFKIILSNNSMDYTKLFNLVKARNIDTDSLYSPRRQRAVAVAEEVTDYMEVSEAAIERTMNLLQRQSRYGKNEINEYVKELLADEYRINASDLPTETTDDFVRLILIFLYSKSVGMSYDIEMLNHDARVNGIKFQNFMVFKKGVHQ